MGDKISYSHRTEYTKKNDQTTLYQTENNNC